MAPAAVERCRVLELGCSTGGNVIPLAVQFPESEIVGIDASGRQVADGQGVVEALGLKNIRLEHRDILNVSEDFGQFDYIITHGVYSWVPDQVQDKILEICDQNLAPNGVAYISYNTYPGWRMRGMIRDVMVYRGAFFDQPPERVHEARALLDFLAHAVPTENNAYGILLADELNLLRDKEDSYLFHEHLEDNNAPEYFYQFMERAAGKGLQYLGEADFSSMSAGNFPPEVEATLRRLAATTRTFNPLTPALSERAQNDASDIVQMEQYMDFVRNRMFRQTLLCHGDIQLEREIPPERIFDMHVATSAKPEDPDLDIRSWDRVTFRRRGSTLTTVEPLVKAAVLHLSQAWPEPVAFRQLLAAARARLHDGPMIVGSNSADREAQALAKPLIRCYATTHIDLSVRPAAFTLQVAPQPVASRLARHQTLDSDFVTNLKHESVPLNDLERHLVQNMDGTNDWDALVEILAREVAGGRLVVLDGGQPVADPDRARQIIVQILEEVLNGLARKCLLSPAE